VQNSLGWSPLGMALGFLPAGLLVALSSTRMGVVLGRVNTAWLIFFGLLALMGAYALFLRTEPSMAYADFMLPTMLLLGVGFALTFPAVNAQATKGVADHEQGLASGLLNTSVQIGGAIVLAVVSAVLSSSGSANVHHKLLPGMTTAITIVVGISLVALLLTAVVLVQDRRRPALAVTVAQPAVLPAE
jgi:sugar phosphate permease